MAVDDVGRPSSWWRVAVAVLLLTAILSVMLVAFGWPATRSSLHGIPIAIAGSGPAGDQLAAQVQAQRPGTFDVTRVGDTAEAERLIRGRDVYAALDTTISPPQMLIASAGSPVIAQAMQQIAQALLSEPGSATGARSTPPVRDVVPLPAKDPRGAGLAGAALPLVLGGIIAAALLTALLAGRSRRLVGTLTFAVTGGLALAAILQFWLGAIEGRYVINSAVVALSIAATALTVLGLESLLGTVGLAIGGALMLLVGNPSSGLTSAPQMLPGAWGVIGQALPPGAAASLLRSTAFFDGHGGRAHALVLAAWALVGAVLLILGSARQRRVGARSAASPQ